MVIDLISNSIKLMIDSNCSGALKEVVILFEASHPFMKGGPHFRNVRAVRRKLIQLC
jgi:hypothetical protein